jgi:hypothetical protein
MRLRRNKSEDAVRVDRVGDRRCQVILARNFYLENPTHEKFTEFREHLSQWR